MRQLCNEVEKRLDDVEMNGKTVTLKLMVFIIKIKIIIKKLIAMFLILRFAMQKHQKNQQNFWDTDFVIILPNQVP